jgi:hypothetical protein
MTIAPESNTATPDPVTACGARQPEVSRTDAASASAVEQALTAAIEDAGSIGDLLDVLRTARLWLPLPDDGSPAIEGTAVTLPTVSYLGSDFVPAYSSAQLLTEFTGTDQPAPGAGTVPHMVVRAVDLARLLPPNIGIALNAGAPESVPVYPQGVSYLAAAETADDPDKIRVGPLPVRPDGLLASIAAGLTAVPAARAAAAAWLSVRSVGEGLLVAVTLDDPTDASVRDTVLGVVERAAWQVPPQDAGFPIDVTFPGETEPDQIDERVAASGTAFYRR